MAALASIATVATGVAAVVGAGASLYSGYLSYQQGQDQAKKYEAAGKAEFAASQRDALEKRLQGQLVLSQQQAAAAASGGGAGIEAPTIVRLMTETSQRAEEAAQTSLYGGAAAKASYFSAADASRQTGINNFLGSVLGGIGMLIGGAGQTAAMADKYNLFPTTTTQNWAPI